MEFCLFKRLGHPLKNISLSHHLINERGQMRAHTIGLIK
ncbi:hypothetical protein SSCHL_0894 [Staphylococcus schleiferi]|nr:hypothetical protein SSCHL_0894 [Staphylococcus schleiferi]